MSERPSDREPTPPDEGSLTVESDWAELIRAGKSDELTRRLSAAPPDVISGVSRLDEAEQVRLLEHGVALSWQDHYSRIPPQNVYQISLCITGRKRAGRIPEDRIAVQDGSRFGLRQCGRRPHGPLHPCDGVTHFRATTY